MGPYLGISAYVLSHTLRSADVSVTVVPRVKGEHSLARVSPYGVLFHEGYGPSKKLTVLGWI